MLPEKYKTVSSHQVEIISTEIAPGFKNLLEQLGIHWSPQWQAYLKSLYVPLAAWLVNKNNQTQVVGINGAQGAGKSTLAAILAWILQNAFDQHIVILSIDDFYLTKAERQKLAEQVHPLLATRGVPGTHDVQLGCSVLKSLTSSHFPEEGVKVPRFDKSVDDRQEMSEWQYIKKPADIVLFEGWCVACEPQSDEALQQAINLLEKTADPKGIWRSYVNQQLNNEYKNWFSYIDTLLLLEVPGIQKVLQWRQLQESKLTQPGMNGVQIEKFIMHFERLMRHCLDVLPGKAELVLELGDDHFVKSVR